MLVIPVPFWVRGFFVGVSMENRIAAVSIIVESPDSVEDLNGVLHGYREFIIGRMGIPHQRRKLSIICVVLDAPGDVISALSGKLGMLSGVTAKTVYSRCFDSVEG